MNKWVNELNKNKSHKWAPLILTKEHAMAWAVTCCYKAQHQALVFEVYCPSPLSQYSVKIYIYIFMRTISIRLTTWVRWYKDNTSFKWIKPILGK